MASPHPPATSNSSSKSSRLEYYYFVVGLALVAIVLVVTNAVTVGCCSWIRRLLSPREFSEAEVRRWIPSHKYRKKAGSRGPAPEEESECTVCLSAFEEGEEVRRLPQCGHSFHASCIDMWLQYRSSCPVCRGSVLPTPSYSVSMEMSAQHHSHDNLIPRLAIAAAAAAF
ncbi:hypothetical protein HPP92_000800 [Vanilla planifolia]|uniref:RING-type E3 ubiquitin transferase n=1 Tax=Vanilla planifolia TaxID=51239 RepID=A0A835RV43_VANPL|nr:hypothetical protein HPP92_000800 [Vanilla planifolia]